MLLDKIHLEPEVIRARQKEARARTEPFLPGAQTLCGVPVRPLTPRLYSWLAALRSPFLLGRDGALGDVLHFLWFLSPAFIFPTHAILARDCAKARQTWLNTHWKRLRRRKLGAVCKAIHRFVDAALFDLEKGASGDNRAAVAHLEAALLDEFCASYGGMVPERLDDRGLPDYRNPGVRDTSLAVLIQMRRSRTLREHGSNHVGNPLSDAAERRVIKRITRAERAAYDRANRPDRRAPARRTQKPR